MWLKTSKSTIADGQNVSINAGSVIGDGGNVQTNTDRINVLLSLIVQPQINNDHSITLTIVQQDNEIDKSELQAAIEGGDKTAAEEPPIDTSTITTRVMVPNNDILVLGGLLKKDSDIEKTGIPILSKIILGRLFTFRNMLNKI